MQSGQAFAGIRLSLRDAFAVAPSQRSPLLWALNALNVADALLTATVLRSGMAVEGNPVVRAIGLPGKVIVVALAGWLINRLRPRALIVPVIAMGLVVAWTTVNVVARGSL